MRSLHLLLVFLFSFQLSAACVEAWEYDNTIPAPKCPAGQTISTISFASFGRPSGSCGSYKINRKCHASNSLNIVKGLCLKKNGCQVPAEVSLFGDPCSGVHKKLAIQYSCTTTTVNQPPVVNAGADRSITLPTSSVSLAGSASDPDGSIAALQWSKVSGAGTQSISASTALSTTISGLTSAGTYVFRLTVTDNAGAVASDDVQVTVNPAPVSSALCASAGEYDSQIPTPTCPSGSVVKSIAFASFGTPNGSCGSYSVNSACHASTSMSVVQDLCLNRATCAVAPSTALFGDPCSGVVKSLAIQYECGPGTVTPPPTGTAKFYVAPNGDDSNPGTITLPFKTWEKLAQVMVPGDLAYIRGGTYRSSKPDNAESQVMFHNMNGTAQAPIRIFAYPGEKPVLDLSDRVFTFFPKGMTIMYSNYLHLKGLRVTGLVQRAGGAAPTGILIEQATHITLEQMEVDKVMGYGIALNNGAFDNLIKNCDVHHLMDETWGGANGFNITGGVNATRNVFEGNRAWCVSDDGFDLFSTDGVVTYRNNWAFWNGYECANGVRYERGDGVGFKLGPTNSGNVANVVTRTLSNNLAFENKYAGFDNNSANTRFVLYNNTAYANKQFGYFFGIPGGTQISKNNISYKNGGDWGDDITGSNNSWNGQVTVTDADFMSLSSVGMDGPRQADGSLPILPFLRLNTGSDLIDAGANVGLPYNGSAPDLGAFEK